VSFQDTRERIFVNGQIYSRPRFGGRVHGPDTRRFTPDPNPYDVPPEPRGYGQGTVDFGDTTPNPYELPQHNYDPITPEERERIRILEGRGPFPNTKGLDPFSPNPFRNLPLDYLNQFMNDRGILEQNQELSGPKEQVFPRFADPGDGTLSTTPMMMASNVPLLGDDGAGVMRAIRSGDINRIIPGYTDRRDRLRERIMGVLRGV